MPDNKLDVVRFNLDVSLPEVPQQLVDYAKMIKDDQDSPIQTRQLAYLVIESLKCIDRLNRALECSTLTLHVTEKQDRPFRD